MRTGQPPTFIREPGESTCDRAAFDAFAAPYSAGASLPNSFPARRQLAGHSRARAGRWSLQGFRPTNL